MNGERRVKPKSINFEKNHQKILNLKKGMPNFKLPIVKNRSRENSERF